MKTRKQAVQRCWAEKFRRDGDSLFSVRVIPACGINYCGCGQNCGKNGVEQTVECWAKDAWKARTAAMIVCTLKLRGCFLNFEVTPLGDLQ